MSKQELQVEMYLYHVFRLIAFFHIKHWKLKLYILVE